MTMFLAMRELKSICSLSQPGTLRFKQGIDAAIISRLQPHVGGGRYFGLTLMWERSKITGFDDGNDCDEFVKI